MPRYTLAIALCVAVAACGHQSSSASSSSSLARCGRNRLTGATWVGTAGWIGVAVPVGIVGGYYGVWYDPGDTYNPVTDEGNVYGGTDPYYGGAPSYAPGDDGTNDAPVGDDTTGNDTGDDTSYGSDDGSSSTESLKPLAGLGNGCFTCAVGCTATDANGQRDGQQAVGVSDVSYDDACRSGVQSLGVWSHSTLHRPLDTCQQLDTSVAGSTDADAGNAADAGDIRVPAAPVVAR